MNNYDALIDNVLLIGRTMLQNGAEVSRVEDSMGRICKSYGAETVDVFTITSQIVISVKFEGKIFTQSKRVLSHETNFEQLDDLNNLSRYICKHKPNVEELERQRLEIMNKPDFPLSLSFIASILGASAFAIFFGGTLRDSLCAGLLACIIVLMKHHLKAKLNYIVYYVLTSFVVGIIGILLCKIGIGQNIDKILIGAVMLLIPGIAMTNSIRDMLLGDTMSGILRFIESLLMAISIAVGFGFSIYLLGGIL